MAFTLSTIYKAVDKFSPVVKQMERANSSFAAKQDKAFKQMGSAISNVKNQLIGLAGGLSVASLFYAGSKAVVDFDTSLGSLKAITGLTGKAFDPFKKEILSIGDATNESYVEIAKTMELLASLDATLLDSSENMGKMTRASVLLSKASGADLAETSSSLASILSIFGASADEASKYVDILSTSEQKGTYTVSQLADGLKTVGGTARVLGLNVDETAALLQALAPSTKSVEKASTGLNSILNKLGVTTNKNFNPAIVGSKKAFQNLADAHLDLKGAQKLVGAERAGMLLSLINQNKVIQELSNNQYIQGNAEKQAAERAATFSEQLVRLKNRFENLIIKGNENSKALNKLGKIIGFLTNHLDKIITVIGAVLVVWGSYYTLMTLSRISLLAYNFALDLYILLSGKSILLMQKQGLALKAYTAFQWLANSAAWGFTAALLANPITWIVVGIMALIAGIVLLIVKWKEVKAWIDKVSNSAVFQIFSIINPIVKIIELIAFMQDRWQGIKKAFSEGGFLEGIKAIGKAIMSFMLKPIEVILGALGKIPGLGFAKKGAEFIAQMRANLDEGLLTPAEEKPVNVQKASNDAQTERYEEITKQQMSFEFYNKTDKAVNVKKNNAPMPAGFNTWDWK